MACSRARRTVYIPVHLETVDIAAVTEAIHAKAGAIDERDWRLDQVGRGVVVADRQRLTQAMMELAQNVAQHTQKETRVALSSAVENGEARLWVRDTGRGIPPEEQGRIFRRLARGRGIGRSGGAGIGPAIVKVIAKGRITVEWRLRVGGPARGSPS